MIVEMGWLRMDFFRFSIFIRPELFPKFIFRPEIFEKLDFRARVFYKDDADGIVSQTHITDAKNLAVNSRGSGYLTLLE